MFDQEVMFWDFMRCETIQTQAGSFTSMAMVNLLQIALTTVAIFLHRHVLSSASSSIVGMGNARVWYSCDGNTGVPADVLARVRLCWLMTHPEDVPPQAVHPGVSY